MTPAEPVENPLWSFRNVATLVSSLPAKLCSPPCVCVPESLCLRLHIVFIIELQLKILLGRFVFSDLSITITRWTRPAEEIFKGHACVVQYNNFPTLQICNNFLPNVLFLYQHVIIEENQQQDIYYFTGHLADIRSYIRID